MYETEGTMQATPIAFNNVVYIGTATGKVAAISAIDGNMIWEYQTNREILASPALGDGRVFFGSMDGKVYAFSTE